MLNRRAPTTILVCTIALWVIAGFLSGGAAYAAGSGPAYYQQESPTGGGAAPSERPVSLSVTGDPDEYAHSDDGTPVPGDGTNSQPGKTFIDVLIQILAVWWSQVWGLPPQ